MNAVSYIVLFVTSLLAAIVASAIILSVLVDVTTHAAAELNSLSDFLASLRMSSGPSSCTPVRDVSPSVGGGGFCQMTG